MTDPNKDEAKCEATTGKVLAKFVASKGKCIAKCIGTARKVSGPYGGCFPPYSDATLVNCLTDTTKGVETKAGAGIAKGCAVDCPECYSGAQCSTANAGNPWVVTTEKDIDDPFNTGNPAVSFPALIYCTEFGGATPSKDVAKCEDGVQKALAKFVGSKSKCYQKCKANELKGKILFGSCHPPTPGDTATDACIHDPAKGAEAKARAAIVKACTVAIPACYNPDPAAQANTFVASVETKVDQRAEEIACGSPSAAFLD